VERADELRSKKKSGPNTWVKVSYGGAQHQTSVACKTLQPEWQSNFRFLRCDGEPIHFVLCRKSKLLRGGKIRSSAVLDVPRQVSILACGLYK
jgi:C2 domain